MATTILTASPQALPATVPTCHLTLKRCVAQDPEPSASHNESPQVLQLCLRISSKVSFLSPTINVSKDQLAVGISPAILTVNGNSLNMGLSHLFQIHKSSASIKEAWS